MKNPLTIFSKVRTTIEVTPLTEVAHWNFVLTMSMKTIQSSTWTNYCFYNATNSNPWESEKLNKA
jgi:hypothetical protein